MVSRSVRSQLMVAVMAACVAFLAVVSASHLHSRRVDDALRSECQLCLAGQVNLSTGAVVAAWLGLVFLTWCALRPPVAAPQAPTTRRPATRAPPVQ